MFVSGYTKYTTRLKIDTYKNPPPRDIKKERKKEIKRPLSIFSIFSIISMFLYISLGLRAIPQKK